MAEPVGFRRHIVIHNMKKVGDSSNSMNLKSNESDEMKITLNNLLHRTQ